MIENSILIPVFGNEKLVHNLLATLIPTLDNECEVIIIDDGYKDMKISKELLPETIQYISNDTNLGYSATINRGLKESKGTFITTINTDILVDRNWLQATRQAFQTYSKIGLLGSKLIYPDYGLLMHCGVFFGKRFCFNAFRMSDANFSFANDFRQVQAVADTFATMQKEVLLEVGGYDESYFTSVEDLDLCMKFASKGFNNFYNPKIVGFHKTAASGEHRYKQVVEDKVQFFDRWQFLIKDDTSQIFEESLKRYLQNGNEMPKEVYLININRKNSEETISVFKKLTGIKVIAEFDYTDYIKHTPKYIQKTKVDLLEVLPFNHLNLRYPIVYFTDYYTSLQENHYWSKFRKNQYDLVFDDSFNLFQLNQITN
jgi:GT2 family glycosyltransferase